jgi:hypothetical protein
MRIVSILFASCLVTIAHAGVFVQLAETDMKTHKETLGQSYSIQDGQARSESKKEGTHRYTVFKNDAVYVVDTQAKSYRVFDKKAAAEMADKVGAAMEKMKARMANMPPQQRAVMEQMLAKRGGAMGQAKNVYDAVSTGQSMSVGGRSCRVWNETENGKLDKQLCVVPFSELPGSDELLAVMQKMGKVFEGLRQQLGGSTTGGWIESRLALAQKINGFPVSTRDYVDGKLADTADIVKVWQKQPIAASQFVIPADYKQIGVPGSAQTREPKQAGDKHDDKH